MIGSTTARGYGSVHQKVRERFAAQIALGGMRCARCDRMIWPNDPWDLGHDDFDRNRWTGPEHRRCNRATASHRARRVSRPW